MELEINEPFLHIGSSSLAATCFAEAIVRSTAKAGDRRADLQARNTEATS